MTTLVNTNVLLDIATSDPRWAPWSLYQLDAAAIRGPILINAVVYAEFSIGYTRIEEVDRVLAEARLELTGIPRTQARYFNVIAPKTEPRRAQRKL